MENRSIFGYFALLACMGILVFSCATKPEVYGGIDQAVDNNEFEVAIEVLKKGQEGKKPIYPEKNAVSLRLDKGLLEHYAGNYANSSEDLQEAERLIQEAFTKSVTQEFTSYIANDNTKEYPGEDYEDLYLNVFNALNYYHKGDIDGAMVEIRKITLSNGKLDMLSRKYTEGQQSAGDGAMDALKKIGFNINPALPQGDPVQFSDSALARYLGALFYQAQGNADSARIEFERIPAAFSSNPKVYKNPIPAVVAGVQNIPRGQAPLHIIGFTGLSPVKEEVEFKQTFPFFQNVALRDQKFALPVLKPRPDSIDRIEVIVEGHDGRGVFELELLEDMGAVAAETFNARFANIFFKTYIRTMLKYAAADIAATAAAEKSGGGALAGLGASIGGKLIADASESADIRMSRFFPSKAYVGGIALEPGTYNITINYYSRGSHVGKDERKDFEVKANTPNIIETINLK